MGRKVAAANSPSVVSVVLPSYLVLPCPTVRPSLSVLLCCCDGDPAASWSSVMCCAVL